MDVIYNLIVDYGWQALVIALLTFIAVECIKPVARKFIEKENLRHILYIGCTYVFAVIFSFVLAVILKRISDTFTLFAPAAVVINALGQIISNAGFWNWIEGLIKDAWTSCTENGAWKKAIKEIGSKFGVDATLLDTVATKVENEYLPLIKKGADVFFAENKNELILNIKQKLAGFVSNENLQNIADSLFDKLSESWNSQKVTEQVANDTVTTEEVSVNN